MADKYDHQAPPTPISGREIDIGIQLMIKGISCVNVVESTVELSGYMYWVWDDARLQNYTSESDEGFDGLWSDTEKKKDLWRPPLQVANACEDNFTIDHEAGDAYPKLQSKGLLHCEVLRFDPE